MTLVDLDALAAMRHPNSWGSLGVEGNPAGVLTFRSVDCDEDAIGLLAFALREALERYAANQAVAMTRLPEKWR